MHERGLHPGRLHGRASPTVNNDSRDGCEYRCTTSGTGAEVCDGQDNDCDGMIDNDTTDGGQSCGGMPGGTGECRQGQVTCVNGTLICLGAGTPGTELCDGKDNDCDGMTDEDDPFAGKACYPVGVSGCDVTAGTCTGPCKLGSWACSAGRLTCGGVVTPVLETCDNADNDCDGMVDEGYDKQNDPRFCGGCNIQCSYPNAIALCSSGACSGALHDRLDRRQRHRRRRLRIPVHLRGPGGVRRPGQRLRRPHRRGRHRPAVPQHQLLRPAG